ncbi:MAG: YifB family Mg chelatase-like AAA ATPase [Ignavibacteriales bacterium]
MVGKIKSAGLMGLNGYIVEVEIDISNGIPAFDIVGLPDAAVKESKERVRAAIKNSGYEFPVKRITVNLAPANTKKEGPAYDLPIALAILSATEQIKNDELEKYIFLGELSLDGQIKPVNGVLPMTITAYKEGLKKIVIPVENAEEAGVVKDIEVLPAASIEEVILHINGEKNIARHFVDVESLFKAHNNYDVDFADVKGQENVKRALEVSAAGAHNILMIGSPGSGKTMMARRLPTILPDLSFEEALEITKIHSIAGFLPPKTSLITTRPFRSPHHTVSAISLVGGGRIPKPGEISLAHYGVLFLDELTEFQKDALEVMRQPLEDGIVTVSRVNATLTYPSRFMLISSMNPCKCGFLLDPSKNCTCTSSQVQQYLSKVSGPLLDRVDIHIEVAPVKYKELDNDSSAETSDSIRKRVNKAREIQLERYKGMNIFFNSQLQSSGIARFCKIGQEERELLKGAFERLGLSARAHNRILKVARTIADLDESETIKVPHIAEAIQYRSLDRKFWSGE